MTHVNNSLYKTTFLSSVQPMFLPNTNDYENKCSFCGVSRRNHVQINHVFEEPILAFIQSERCNKCGVPRSQHLARHAFVESTRKSNFHHKT